MANAKKMVNRKPYGVKAYGSWVWFDTKDEAIEWCIEGVCGCEGAERDRYADALDGFRGGWNYINTDSP